MKWLRAAFALRDGCERVTLAPARPPSHTPASPPSSAHRQLALCCMVPMSAAGHNRRSPSTAHCPLSPAADMRQRQPWAAMCQQPTRAVQQIALPIESPRRREQSANVVFLTESSTCSRPAQKSISAASRPVRGPHAPCAPAPLSVMPVEAPSSLRQQACAYHHRPGRLPADRWAWN